MLVCSRTARTFKRLKRSVDRSIPPSTIQSADGIGDGGRDVGGGTRLGFYFVLFGIGRLAIFRDRDRGYGFSRTNMRYVTVGHRSVDGEFGGVRGNARGRRTAYKTARMTRTR